MQNDGDAHDTKTLVAVVLDARTRPGDHRLPVNVYPPPRSSTTAQKVGSGHDTAPSWRPDAMSRGPVHPGAPPAMPPLVPPPEAVVLVGATDDPLDGALDAVPDERPDVVVGWDAGVAPPPPPHAARDSDTATAAARTAGRARLPDCALTGGMRPS
jgi:hypothetical protein